MSCLYFWMYLVMFSQETLRHDVTEAVSHLADRSSAVKSVSGVESAVDTEHSLNQLREFISCLTPVSCAFLLVVFFAERKD